jgi:hypothetical protein
MEAVRKIMNADALAPLIDLPWKGKDMKVEIIVMPAPETARQTSADAGASLKGRLREYANPALAERERRAWEDNAVAKYGAL